MNPGKDRPERPGESQGVVVVSEEREIGPRSNLRPLEPLQRAALWVALGVGVMILLVGAPLTIAWVTGGPPPPRLEGLSPDAAKTILEQYRQLVQIHEEAARARFDEIVLKSPAADPHPGARLRLRQPAGISRAHPRPKRILSPAHPCAIRVL